MATRKQLEAYAQNPRVRKFLDLIAHTEGTEGNGYRTAFGGGRLSSLGDHPRYMKSFKQKNGKTNKTSAAGRYQFLSSTWDGVAKKYGLNDFSPKNQDIGAIALLIQNGALGSILKGDMTTAVRKSGSTWASLPTAPASYSQPTKSWKSVNKFLGGKGVSQQSDEPQWSEPQWESQEWQAPSWQEAEQPQWQEPEWQTTIQEPSTGFVEPEWQQPESTFTAPEWQSTANEQVPVRDLTDNEPSAWQPPQWDTPEQEPPSSVMQPRQI